MKEIKQISWLISDQFILELEDSLLTLEIKLSQHKAYQLIQLNNTWLFALMTEAKR